ncbi:MAG: ROK family transcriptional regulator [Bifidobacteriaceae bacterium]|jgi:predicted NBD/HSP70 family sugar kinase|nr:ROK family transcriptional regulator [Bifidobacteriaceae bacterium]MCI1978481.1 ROK family transcriptional regulator [Bifidobacteriaceae bacterium]
MAVSLSNSVSSVDRATSAYVASQDQLKKAGPADVRVQNRAVVMRMLFRTSNLSRADLARETGLTRVAVSEVVSGLIEDSLVMETGQKASAVRGRRGTALRVDPDGRRIVSIDLSQPHVVLGAVSNLLGQIIFREERPIDGTFSASDLAKYCAELVATATAPVLGIGVAVPGTVSERGVVTSSISLGWHDVPLAATLLEETGLPVQVDNDANSAALAEKQFGKVDTDLIFVHIARGVGAGTVVGNSVISGVNNIAGEIGHVVVKRDGELCSCGKKGCLETLVSASVIERQCARLPSSRADVIKEAGIALGEALSMPVSLLDIPTVVVYGQANIVTPGFVEAAGKTLNEFIKTDFRKPVDVRRSRVGDDIVLKGEIAAVLRSQIGI